MNSVLKYQQHRDTSMAAFNKLPAQWRLSKLGFEAWVRARLGWKGLKAEEYVDEGFAFLATPNIKPRDIDFENVNYITKERYDESPEIKLRAGDVLLAKDGSTLGTVNCVRSLPRPATVNSSIAVITSRRHNQGLYIYYLFQSRPWVDLIAQLKGGMGVPHLFQSDLTKFPIPLPPPSEQRQIAAVLELETARIDALIERKTRFIELLKEKRQALITQAVTKGLDPTVPMKDSGVEWIGEVPAHWTILPLKRHTKIGNGSTPSRNEPRYWTGGEFPWLTSGFANYEKVTHADEFVTKRALQECHLPAVAPPAILVGITGQGKTRGMATTLMIEATINQHIAYIKPLTDGIDLRYLRRFLDSAYEWLRFVSDGVGSTKGAITCAQLASLQLPLPPREEQTFITDWIREKTSRMAYLVELSEKSIQLLRERRSALITAAVTGQIDLREDAA